MSWLSEKPALAKNVSVCTFTAAYLILALILPMYFKYLKYIQSFSGDILT